MKLLLAILFSFILCVKIEGSTKQIVIWAQDGSKVSYALEEKPKITFDDNNIIIQTSSAIFNYPLSQMFQITYEIIENSNIKDVFTDKIIYNINEETIIFPFIKANSTMKIFNMNGMVLFEKIFEDDGEYSIPLNSLLKGVYIIAVNSKKYKIIKK